MTPTTLISDPRHNYSRKDRDSTAPLIDHTGNKANLDLMRAVSRLYITIHLFIEYRSPDGLFALLLLDVGERALLASQCLILIVGYIHDNLHAASHRSGPREGDLVGLQFDAVGIARATYDINHSER